MTNIYNLFKFIEDKEGKAVPLVVKLVHVPESITPEDLEVEGDLYLNNTTITSLPDNLQVGGNLSLSRTKITSLPDNLKVGGNLYLRTTPLSKTHTKEEIKAMVPNVQGFISL